MRIKFVLNQIIVILKSKQLPEITKTKVKESNFFKIME